MPFCARPPFVLPAYLSSSSSSLPPPEQPLFLRPKRSHWLRIGLKSSSYKPPCLVSEITGMYGSYCPSLEVLGWNLRLCTVGCPPPARTFPEFTEKRQLLWAAMTLVLGRMKGSEILTLRLEESEAQAPWAWLLDRCR